MYKMTLLKISVGSNSIVQFMTRAVLAHILKLQFERYVLHSQSHAWIPGSHSDPENSKHIELSGV